ncbi:hypothetical protein CJ030_MR7G011397 [Morella rubra]|uniref:GRF-type domain-containing protein n=1 Tax=Morella rubra TaxID=262757 RepID=A0A6A1V4C9_9ROSI|nr:hypothetical protein CJ030_MR7G011397 [Morella rubra]
MYSDFQSSSRRSGVSQRGFVSKCSGGQQPNAVICGCDLPARLCTSLTDSNPERQFYGCLMNSGDTKKDCNFFQWVDPPTCPRGQQFFPPILKKVKKLEDEAQKFKDKEKR